MSDYPAEIDATARHLHELLANCQYPEMESFSNGRRLTADEIANSVRDYGRCVVSPPADLHLDVVKIEVERNSWSVYMPIFTMEEGKSDLTLEVTMTKTGEPLCDVEIDGLHVL